MKKGYLLLVCFALLLLLVLFVLSVLSFGITIKYKVEPDIDAANECYFFMNTIFALFSVLFAVCIVLLCLLLKYHYKQNK